MFFWNLKKIKFGSLKILPVEKVGNSVVDSDTALRQANTPGSIPLNEPLFFYR